MIPRYRGYPYKNFKLDKANSDDIQYALCGKGYPMQELSSISLGPVIGEGLCVFNSACSKSICIEHIEGGGCFDINSKNFWKRSKKPLRIIIYKNYQIFIDGISVNINNWLKKMKICG